MPSTNLSNISNILLVPILQGGHFPQDSSTVKSKKNLAKFGLDSKDTVGIENMVNTLLMSTSVPVIESGDPIEGDETSITNYYSPRKQGSGIADLNAAVNTPSYITVAGSKRPKAELGYNTKGQYSFEYTIKNTSDKEVRK